MHDEDATSAVEVSLVVPADITTTWECVLNPSRWWPATTIDARVGGVLREEWTNASGTVIVTTAMIDRFEPPRVLAMTWRDADWEPGLRTRVCINLTAVDVGRTEVGIGHAGWEQFGVSGALLRDEHHAGWRHHLQSLSAALRLG